MSFSRKAWHRWKGFAHRTTVMQSNAVLLVLYFVFFVPIGLLRRLFIRRSTGVLDPSWHARQPADRSLDVARRQF